MTHQVNPQALAWAGLDTSSSTTVDPQNRQTGPRDAVISHSAAVTLCTALRYLRLRRLKEHLARGTALVPTAV